jgi:gamma-glutamylcyclotransferase (GGCT)/AIG2-like uncharacterized protein YtfP|tara:strand:+ start:4225 stop:4644 length:420 start_codon:yes stop_codon:yes gene_type:complete
MDRWLKKLVSLEKQNNKTMKVFVYGTLKKGGGNDIFLQNSKYLGSGWTHDKYRLFTDGSLPYVDKKESNYIKGEVYDVDEWTFMSLDNLEGHPYFYQREETWIEVPEDEEIVKDYLCWMYFINEQPTSKVVEIKSGEWK